MNRTRLNNGSCGGRLDDLLHQLLLSDQGFPTLTASELLKTILKVFNGDGGLLRTVQVIWDLFFSEYTPEDVVVESSVVGVNEGCLIIPS